ncbi:MAG: class I SAM-dependent methyltransferase [Hyphomicrobiaceae bacterium]
MQKTADVRTYFTERARLFDALYEGETGFSRRFNEIFRRPMLERYVLTLEGLGRLEGRRILDVGCGSGRYAVELARGGAFVTGVDFSPEMIAMANERIAAMRADNPALADRVSLVAGDFLEWSAGMGRKFDAAFAMGVLDYVEDAKGFIARMAEVADEVIASFPRPTAVRMPLRKLRYAMRNCPVHFYRQAEVEAMYRAAGLDEVTVRPLGGAGFWVHGQRG